MPEPMIKATVEGMYPVADVAMMATYYANLFGVPCPETDEEQREFILAQAKKVLVDFLKGPAFKYYTETSKAELAENIAALEERVASSLSITSEIVEL